MPFGLDRRCLTSQIPTRLCVIELTTALLSALCAGAGSWRIIRSKGVANREDERESRSAEAMVGKQALLFKHTNEEEGEEDTKVLNT